MLRVGTRLSSIGIADEFADRRPHFEYKQYLFSYGGTLYACFEREVKSRREESNMVHEISSICCWCERKELILLVKPSGLCRNQNTPVSCLCPEIVPNVRTQTGNRCVSVGHKPKIRVFVSTNVSVRAPFLKLFWFFGETIWFWTHCVHTKE